MKEKITMTQHDNRTYLITGGALGIGAATSRFLAEQGAEVLVADINKEAANKTVSEIVRSGGKASFVYLDLSDAKSISELGPQLANSHNALHGLVNNAGIYRSALIEDIDESVWEPQISINLKAPVLVLQTLLPMLRKGPGHIVNLSSEAGYNARSGNAVYDATKAAISALTRTMACEGAEYGMRANAVAPGPVVTELHTLTAPDPVAKRQELLNADFPANILRRWAEPHEIASVISFLLSDGASYISGEVIHADGGHVAK